MTNGEIVGSAKESINSVQRMVYPDATFQSRSRQKKQDPLSLYNSRKTNLPVGVCSRAQGRP